MDPVSKIVASHATPARLGKQLSAQKALFQRVRQYLPPPLDSQLKAAVMQEQTLSLFVSSPVWASRLRYLIPQLHRQLRESGLRVERLRTRILPDERAGAAKPTLKRRLKLSRESGELLRRTAASISDRQLRDAMLRLSSHCDSDN
ncbi:MAG: DUF721 domain-containing protein [Candidatus Thiodiazotropha sp. (ex Dulcina madagascariensis)]|nr:DUF721 domain-containing protein [Candidatus Thiodiazotropha sp. (ex Dulcina madagascariensis)]MCU7925614.1 DUF721 domain-containing protein [Candidatus Thiodiazotropha sp. (ex Dulcina madagascariensis)]